MAKSFTLVLNMHGLCFFLPDEENKAMHLLLMDPALAEVSQAAEDHHASPRPPHRHDTHHPMLVVNRLYVADDSPRRPNFEYSDGNRMAAFYLRDVDLTIGEGSKLDVKRADIDTCPTEKNLGAFDWVIPLDRIDAALGDLNPQCLDGRRIHPEVAARVHLVGGHLGTATFASPRNQSTHIWEFVPVGGSVPTHRQAVADVVQLRLDIKGDEFELKFPRLRDALPLPNLKLVPISGEEMVVWIKCMPIEDILKLRPVQELIPGQARPRDSHFAHFFHLFGPGHLNQHSYMPRLSQQFCEQTTFPPPTLGSPPCPGARLHKKHHNG